MIFVFDNCDKCLAIFPNEKEAIAACEGIDVEEAPCNFWNNEGQALKVVFTKPNKRSYFTVVSGKYHLELDSEGEPLINRLACVSYVESQSTIDNVEAVRQYLTDIGSR